MMLHKKTEEYVLLNVNEPSLEYTWETRVVLFLKDGTKELVDAPKERLGHKHIDKWLEEPHRYGCEWNIEAFLGEQGCRYYQKGEFIIGEWGIGYSEANMESGKVRRMIPANQVKYIIPAVQCKGASKFQGMDFCERCNVRFVCWTSK